MFPWIPFLFTSPRAGCWNCHRLRPLRLHLSCHRWFSCVEKRGGHGNKERLLVVVF
ncbi:hypothetical protein Hanom_Chr03g00215321 [Helianthus anomalus]